LPGEILRDLHKLCVDQFQALLLKASDNPSRQMSANAVGLDNNQSVFCHRRLIGVVLRCRGNDVYLDTPILGVAFLVWHIRYDGAIFTEPANTQPLRVNIITGHNL